MGKQQFRYWIDFFSLIPFFSDGGSHKFDRQNRWDMMGELVGERMRIKHLEGGGNSLEMKLSPPGVSVLNIQWAGVFTLL